MTLAKLQRGLQFQIGQPYVKNTTGTNKLHQGCQAKIITKTETGTLAVRHCASTKDNM